MYVHTPRPVHNTYKHPLAGEIGAGVSGATAAVELSMSTRGLAAALGKHPREMHTPATRSTPVWRTDHIDIIIYGHRDGQMFSGNAFPAIGHVGVVRDGNYLHVRSQVQEIETNEITPDPNHNPNPNPNTQPHRRCRG